MAEKTEGKRVVTWETALAAFQKARANGDEDKAKKIKKIIRGFSVGVKKLEQTALAKGMTQEQVNYTYETDRLIGAPKGATLAQIRQESGFNPKAKSPTGAAGLTQFTGIALDDNLFGRKASTPEEKKKREEVRAALYDNPDLALEHQRQYLQTLRRRNKDATWDKVYQKYNGSNAVLKSGKTEQEDYIEKIQKYLTEPDHE